MAFGHIPHKSNVEAQATKIIADRMSPPGDVQPLDGDHMSHVVCEGSPCEIDGLVRGGDAWHVIEVLTYAPQGHENAAVSVHEALEKKVVAELRQRCGGEAPGIIYYLHSRGEFGGIPAERDHVKIANEVAELYSLYSSLGPKWYACFNARAVDANVSQVLLPPHADQPTVFCGIAISASKWPTLTRWFRIIEVVRGADNDWKRAEFRHPSYWSGWVSIDTDWLGNQVVKKAAQSTARKLREGVM